MDFFDTHAMFSTTLSANISTASFAVLAQD
jgi:hypothetical protein